MNRWELMRYERGWSRGRLAEESGVPDRTLRYLEEEEGRKPSAETAHKLAHAYGVSMSTLMGLEPTARGAKA